MKRCPKCGRTHEDAVISCDCGQNLSNEQKVEKHYSSSSSYNYEYKYPALISISKILKFIAYVVLLVSIGFLIYGLTLLDNYDKSQAIAVIVSSIVGGFIGFILILAYSELIAVFLDIEENTRKS